MRKLYADILVIPELLFQYLVLCCSGRRMGQKPAALSRSAFSIVSLLISTRRRWRKREGGNSGSRFLKVTMLPTDLVSPAKCCCDLHPKTHYSESMASNNLHKATGLSRRIVLFDIQSYSCVVLIQRTLWIQSTLSCLINAATGSFLSLPASPHCPYYSICLKLLLHIRAVLKHNLASCTRVLIRSSLLHYAFCTVCSW